MRIIWVSPDGSDITGNGSYTTPYQTIECAIYFFTSGDQIRLKDGIYNPIDTLLFFGVDGSIFAETPLGATIKPHLCWTSSAVLEIINSNRFTVQGVNIRQAVASASNQVGIAALNVQNIIVRTCDISEFSVTSGGVSTVGIAISGEGRIEDCDIHNFVAATDDLYGISVSGAVHIIGCNVYELSGGGACRVHPIYQCVG